MEFTYTLLIPKDRVAALIGIRGEKKRELEKNTKSKLDVTRDGDVTISGDDSVVLFQLQNTIKAIGRGFNPEKAKLLLRPDYILEIVTITDFVKNTKGHKERVRARMIGTDGKCRGTIEKLSEAYISIYGKTVSIIGTTDRANLARHAVEQILSGSPHANVYKKLEESSANLYAEKKRE